MSEENVARLRAAIEAFNQRDGTKFDRLLAPDVPISSKPMDCHSLLSPATP